MEDVDLQTLTREELIEHCRELEAAHRAEITALHEDVMSSIRMRWEADRPALVRAHWRHHPDFPGSQFTLGRRCMLWLEARPSSRDRGLFIAHVEAWGDLFLDSHDGWSRYYFSELRAKQEVDAWLDARGEQLAAGEAPAEIPEHIRKQLPRDFRPLERVAELGDL